MGTSQRRPLLVIGGESETAGSLVVELRRLGRTAVWVDTCESALEAIQEVDFDIVILNVDGAADLPACARIATRATCPVVIGTRLLSPDRRYRRQAFRAGASAYMCPPYSRKRLREMIERATEGDTCVELVEGAPFAID